MTPSKYKQVIRCIDLLEADHVERFDDYLYYWFDLSDDLEPYDEDCLCIITYKGEKAGIFHIWGDDIVLQVQDEYKSKGIMSTFLRNSEWKSWAKYCQRGITISSETLGGIDDFDMKVHLIKDIMGWKCRNADEIIQNHLLIDHVSDEIYHQRHKYKGDGNLHCYKDILKMMGVEQDGDNKSMERFN